MILFALYSPLFTACSTPQEPPEATPPVISDIYISPEEGAKTQDQIYCVTVTEVSEMYATTLNLEWKNETSGTVLGTQAQLLLDRSIVQPQDIVSCTATVSNEKGSATASAEIEILNTPPVFTEVDIAPEGNRYTDSLLNCSAIATDEDGTLPTLSYSWSRLPLSTGEDEVLENETSTSLQLTPEAFDVGDIITCTVTAEDSYGESVQDSSSIQISNRTPTGDSIDVDFSGDTVKQDSYLTCNATGSDADLEDLTLSYSWEYNGNILSVADLDPTSESEETYTDNSIQVSDITDIGVGDGIKCIATFEDPHGSQGQISSLLTITNSEPVFTSEISIDPATARTGTTHTCSAVAEDLNDGILDLSYTWNLDGAVVSEDSVITLSGSEFIVGASLTCSVSATDSNGSSITSVSTPLVIENTSPTLEEVVLTTDSGSTDVFAGDTLSCAVQGAEDIDLGQVLTTTFVWEHNGAVLTDETSNTLILSSNIVAGDTVSCSATVKDDSDAGDNSVTGSASLTLSNTAPTILNTDFASDTYTAQSTIAASFTVSDPDEDPTGLTTSILWETISDDGSFVTLIEGTDTTLDTETYALTKGDVVQYTLTVTDASGSQATATSAQLTLANSDPTVSITVSDEGFGVNDTIETFVSESNLPSEGPYILIEGSDIDAQDGLELSNTWEIQDIVTDADDIETIEYTSLDIAEPGTSFIPLDEGLLKGDIIKLTATVSDGEAETSAETLLTIVNTAPTIVVTVAEDDATGDLICSTETDDADDNDVDGLTETFSWYVDDVLHIDSSTEDTADTIDSADIALGAVWVCEVEVSDDETSSTDDDSIDTTVVSE